MIHIAQVIDHYAVGSLLGQPLDALYAQPKEAANGRADRPVHQPAGHSTEHPQPAQVLSIGWR